MHETPAEIDRLQQVLDKSASEAGSHLSSIITADRRLNALQVTERLKGMFLLVLATVTADGRPLVGPVDGYLLHGSFYFSSASTSVRMGHLAVRPWVSAAHVPNEELAITVHGKAKLFDLSDPDKPDLLRAMLDHYPPNQDGQFESGLDSSAVIGARIEAEKIFTFHL